MCFKCKILRQKNLQAPTHWCKCRKSFIFKHTYAVSKSKTSWMNHFFKFRINNQLTSFITKLYIKFMPLLLQLYFAHRFHSIFLFLIISNHSKATSLCHFYYFFYYYYLLFNWTFLFTYVDSRNDKFRRTKTETEVETS